MKELKIEVVEVKDRCGARHKVGDYFFIRGDPGIGKSSSGAAG